MIGGTFEGMAAVVTAEESVLEEEARELQELKAAEGTEADEGGGAAVRKGDNEEQEGKGGEPSWRPRSAVGSSSVSWSTSTRPSSVPRRVSSIRHHGGAAADKPPPISSWMLVAIMAFLTVGGTALTVLTKLMTIPMAHYAPTLTIATIFLMVPVAAIYALGKWLLGSLDPATLRFNWREIAAISAMYAVGQWLVIFGTQYTSGPMQVLLAQAAIPFSMAISRAMMRATYQRRHYVGALLVFLGILISVGGSLGHEGSISTFEGLWILGYVLAWGPITLWTVYGECLYKRNDVVDPILLTGVASAVQLPFLVMLAPVFAFACRPQVPLPELPQNLYDGLRCLVGVNSRPGDDCALSPVYVSAVCLLNVVLVFPSFALLQHGSSTVLWLACTLIVPLSSLCFSLPFIPGHVPATAANGLALVIICAGLATYGFSKKAATSGLERLRRHGHKHFARLAGVLPAGMATAVSAAGEEEQEGQKDDGGGGDGVGGDGGDGDVAAASARPRPMHANGSIEMRSRREDV